MGNVGVRGFSGPSKRLASPMVYMIWEGIEAIKYSRI